jgi:hypothetical protein
MNTNTEKGLRRAKWNPGRLLPDDDRHALTHTNQLYQWKLLLQTQ